MLQVPIGILLLAAAAATSAFADDPLASRTLVVYATNSPDSIAVKDHYIAARFQTPSSAHVCAITLPDPAAPYVAGTVYASSIQTPIRDCLTSTGKSNILYIVLAYIRPYRVCPVTRCYSLDAYLADIWDEYTNKEFGTVPSATHNYYAENQNGANIYLPFVSLATYRAQPGNQLIYSVWRLDGASPAIAIGLIDKTTQAMANPSIGSACIDRYVPDLTTVPDSGARSGDWDLHRAAEFFGMAGLNVVEDAEDTEFGSSPSAAKCPPDGSPVSFYSGWYSLNHYNGVGVFKWAPGAIGFHLDSGSALDPRTGANWSANALLDGISVTSGAVDEPYLEGLPRPAGIFRNLLEGANVGDAFLRNTRWLKWMILNIGDPLYRPFPAAGRAPFQVSQAGTAGSASLAQTVVSLPAAGGSSALNLTTDVAGYDWMTQSTAAWLTVTPTSGLGNASVTVQAQANSGTSRSAMVTIAGQSVTVIQAGSNGNGAVAVSPASVQAPAAGASGSISITASAFDFGWYAATNAGWITVTTAQGRGSGLASYTVQPNSSVASRQGSIVVADKVITVVQNGNQSASIDPPSAVVSFAGGAGSISVVANAADYSWTAASNANWLSVTVSGSSTGSAQVNYSVQPNPSASPRTASATIAGQTFTVTQGGPNSALRFVPLTPCRIVDTRLAAGPFGGPALASGTQRDFIIPQGPCGIPQNAQAYSLNVTAIPRTGLGFLTVWPAGGQRPMVSTLNSVDGRIVANAAITGAGAGGAISVYAEGDTDLVLDVNGYFVTPDNPAGLEFFPIAPCRVADTRLGPGTFGGPAVAANASRDFPVSASGCGVPASAQAYSLNITAVPFGPLGFLTAWPAGRPRPLASTLNAMGGGAVANAAMVPAGANGAVSIFVTNPSNVVIDINGYFSAPAAGGLQFYTVAPCRGVDTRSGQGPLGGPLLSAGTARTLPLAGGACALPASSQVFALNATVVPQGPLGFLTLWAAGQQQPGVSTLNSFNGGVVANAAIVPTSGGAINVYATWATDLVLDVNGYFAP